MLSSYTILSFGIIFPSFVVAYKWPNPELDELDHQLFDQKGYNAMTSISQQGVANCSLFFQDGRRGRQNAAEWVRTAFHDMAIHDAATGTGGLDASIAVELDREENKGTGILETMAFFIDFVTPRVSLSDLLAMSVVTAMDSCGGPEIPYRWGRIDNFTPSPAGVPEPHQDLQTHKNMFSRMGFTQEEMIGLVACGHSLGGVHHSNFPGDTNMEGVQRFDSTFALQDNKVAVEFLAGTPNNPLAFGSNVTTRSDHRIFTSDGNHTISRFAGSNELFESTCSSLLERMINTVPSGVSLSKVVKPIPVKPKLFFSITSDGHLKLSGEVRFFNLKENLQRTVVFKWHDRDGRKCSDRTNHCSSPATHTPEQVTSTFRGTQSVWYSFSVLIDSKASISHFWFEIDEHDGTPTRRMKNEQGKPFPVEDRFFIVPDKSCTDTPNPSSSPHIQVINATFAVSVLPLYPQFLAKFSRTGKGDG
ncbi:heme peroxidase [Serendipita vermifera]|nr:heme peroxidase [Serendipita vermifera]